MATSAEEACTSAPPTEYVKCEYIDALRAHAPGLIEQVATGHKHVTMLKDDVRGEIWFLSKTDHHIVPKYTIMGSYGSGTLGPRNLAISEAVPFCLCQVDKSMVQIITSVEEDSKSKPTCGTLYLLAKPLEKNVAQKGTSLTITAYGWRKELQASMPTPSNSQKDTPSTKAWTTSWHLKSQGRQALRPHPPATFSPP